MLAYAMSQCRCFELWEIFCNCMEAGTGLYSPKSFYAAFNLAVALIRISTTAP
jgi:hypothetical protein